MCTSYSAQSTTHSADGKLSLTPGKPPHEAVFVSNMRNNRPRSCAANPKLEYGAASPTVFKCVSRFVSCSIGFFGGLPGEGKLTAQLSDG